MKIRNKRAETPDQLIKNLQSMINEAEGIIKNLGEEHIEEQWHNLRKKFQEGTDRLRESYEDLEETVVSGARTTDETIRDHPYEALAVALGIGVVLGAILKSRS